jgi:hypothetical protein
MRNFILLASLCSMTLLSACGGQQQGYYDDNGNWVAAQETMIHNKRHRAPNPGMSSYVPPRQTHIHNDVEDGVVTRTTTVTTYQYDRAGYYDANGYYVTMDNAMAPTHMLPPRGMCRIWIPERTLDAQPPVETCAGIGSRVPAGSYVIFGG